MEFIDRPSPHGINAIQEPELLVIHAMGQFISIDKKQEAYYRSIGKRLKEGTYPSVEFLEKVGYSAHYLQNPDGSFYKCRKSNKGAYHAQGFNKNSIGIEVLVEGVWSYGDFESLMKSNRNWTTNEQYKELVLLSQELIDYYPNLKVEGVKRHSDISPGRKHDPGKGFSWEWFKGKLRN